uniref:Fibronectin type-III domain-containing protein n=1 Tax=Timema shepardi TaxID=629360 RepID=A0A7R9BB32_TIMSH|nr:unnamed protein product [Timema shepardi]
MIELSTTKLNLEVGKATRDSLEVSWDVAPNSTSTDSRYLVCWAPTGWRHNERCANVTEHQETFTIHDLASCSWYNVSVSALDADGERLAFEIVQQFTDGENSQPPSMEQSLTIDIISNTMTVSHWSLVRNQTCVSSFTVCWKKTDGLNETCRESPAYDDITIKDLDFCTNYTITTYTSSIDGLDSANRTLYRSTGSGNVENVTLSSGPDSITVKWDPPTQGRECFSHFSIFHKNINDQEGEVEVKADVNEYVFTELEGCTQWYFVIRVISDEHVFSRSEGHLISTTANGRSYQYHHLNCFLWFTITLDRNTFVRTLYD